MKVCPICIDGYTLEGERVQICPVCFGAGHVFPEKICQCGRSANYRKDGKEYCGRETCLKALTS